MLPASEDGVAVEKVNGKPVGLLGKAVGQYHQLTRHEMVGIIIPGAGRPTVRVFGLYNIKPMAKFAARLSKAIHIKVDTTLAEVYPRTERFQWEEADRELELVGQ